MAQKGIAVFEFSATDHTEAFGKSYQQVAGTAHILGESWLSPSLEDKLRRFFSLEKGKVFGRPSSTFQYQKGLRECWSGTLNKGL